MADYYFFRLSQIAKLMSAMNGWVTRGQLPFFHFHVIYHWNHSENFISGLFISSAESFSLDFLVSPIQSLFCQSLAELIVGVSMSSAIVTVSFTL